MARLPGLDLVRNVTALLIIGSIVTVAAISLAGRSAPSRAVAGSPSPDVAAVPMSPQPSDVVVAYTNPDGISPAGFDNNYPFAVQAQTLPTYGILWIDDNQRDFHIAVTGDIEGAIEALKDGIPRGITVYFHIARHTNAELCALWDKIVEGREELITHGIVLMGGSCSNMEMRVQVAISPFTPEVVEYMEARYPGPVDYGDGGSVALRQYSTPERLEVRLEAVIEGAEFGLLTCGRQHFPDSALDSAPVDITQPGPALVALRESLQIYAELYGDLTDLPWILAAQDQFGATFLAHDGSRWLEAPVFAGTNSWVPGTIDDCSPREFTSDDYETAEWRLDPAFPAPKPDSFEIHVLVTERACASGEAPYGRVVPPVVTYSADKLRMTIGVRHRGGPAECPSNDSLAVTVVLPEPLGDRDLSGAAAPRF